MAWFLGLMLMGVGALFIGLARPLIKGTVPMNNLYGVRFKKSFESDELWYQINHYGGKQLLQGGIILVALGVLAFFVPASDAATTAFVTAMIVVPLWNCWKSWRYAQRL